VEGALHLHGARPLHGQEKAMGLVRVVVIILHNLAQRVLGNGNGIVHELLVGLFQSSLVLFDPLLCL